LTNKVAALFFNTTDLLYVGFANFAAAAAKLTISPFGSD